MGLGRIVRSRTGRLGVRVAVTATGAAVFTAALFINIPAPSASAVGPPLTQAEVRSIISRTVQYAKRAAPRDPMTVAVVDTEGNSLGVFRMAGSTGSVSVALAKASTGSFFGSDFGSFSTRTAAFIIQDHFPPGLRYAPGGPLYGVEFSSIGSSDVHRIYRPEAQLAPPGSSVVEEFNAVLEVAGQRVRGDLGGLSLYKNGRRVGGLGVDDGRDGLRRVFGGKRSRSPQKSSRIDIPLVDLLVGNPTTGRAPRPGKRYRVSFRNLGRGRAMERAVTAGGRGFLPRLGIRAERITIDGFRTPYANPPGLRVRPTRDVTEGVDGDFDLNHPLRDAASIPSLFEPLALIPPPSAGPGAQIFGGSRPIKFPAKDSTDGGLTQADVERILWQGAQRSNITRGAIRRPIGRAMQCWISVVDTNGEVLGVFRTPDATLFSYDVAVQKARTAMIFSDSQIAFSCRALGLLAQQFYPAGQQDQGTGPIYQVQDGITVALLTGALGGVPPAALKVRNGITVFPGGAPLYKNGVLVGGIGISGDGVDQDDIVADFGSRGFGAPPAIRCDRANAKQLKAGLIRGLNRLSAPLPAEGSLVGPTPTTTTVLNGALKFYLTKLTQARARLSNMELYLGVPFIKHPRHPGPVTIR